MWRSHIFMSFNSSVFCSSSLSDELANQNIPFIKQLKLTMKKKYWVVTLNFYANVWANLLILSHPKIFWLDGTSVYYMDNKIFFQYNFHPLCKPKITLYTKLPRVLGNKDE